VFLRNKIFTGKPVAVAVLLVYLPSYLGQETAKWPFRSSSQAATCYYQFNPTHRQRQSH